MIPWVQIVEAIPVGPGELRLTWTDGVTRDVDVSGWLKQHVLLKMLNDPMVFRDVSVVSSGSGIEWPNGADFCAQALRLLSDEQVEPKARMNV